jgi:hypothetical protein
MPSNQKRRLPTPRRFVCPQTDKNFVQSTHVEKPLEAPHGCSSPGVARLAAPSLLVYLSGCN